MIFVQWSGLICVSLSLLLFARALFPPFFFLRTHSQDIRVFPFVFVCQNNSTKITPAPNNTKNERSYVVVLTVFFFAAGALQ